MKERKIKILLLGSSGMFGTAVEGACKKKEIECVALAHEDIEITRPGELKAAIEKHKPDAVINSAGIAKIDICELDPRKAFDVNSIAVSNLAKICEDNDITLVQVSTQGIFDGRKENGFYTENSKPNPTTIYGASKHAAECFVKSICRKYYIVRLPTLFGNRRNKSLAFIDKVLKWINEGEELRIADDKVDSFGYVRDLADLLISILKERKPFGVYHLANSGKASYYDFVLELVKILGSGTKVHRAKHEEFAKSPCNPLRTASESTKIRPIRSWQEALREYLNRSKEKNMDKLILDGTKLSWHLDRVKKWLNGEKVVPITVEWALTRRCTYRCLYCNYDYTARDRKVEREITKEIAFNFLDDAAEIGVKSVPLGCDGESAGSPILYDVIPYAKKVGLDIALSTNGYALKDDRLEEILPHLTYLRFNISAGEPRRYAEIMGVNESCYHKVCNTIEKCAKIKKKRGLKVTLGLQMVCMPDFGDQVISLAKLGKRLGVDYLVIKHCSDDHRKSLGIGYSKYEKLTPIFKEAEKYSDENYSVIPKWTKILSEGKRKYSHCYGPQFLFQVSASGLVAACGTFFHEKYKEFHIGNIIDTRFKDIVASEKYQQVMNHIGCDKFNNSSCWSLCFQHKLNEFLWDLKEGKISLDECKPKDGLLPQHVNFV